MRLIVLSNPEAGRGRAGPASESFASLARSRGHEVSVLKTREIGVRGLAPILTGADGLVVFGGDGTVHRVLPALIESRVPVCQAPLGTENLFARARGSYGIDAGPGLLGMVESGRTRAIDAARAGSSCFSLMCGVGPDAAVVHRLAANRRGSITRWSYAGPLAREAFAGTPPCLTVSVDGRAIASGERGQLLVANSPEYGARLNPVPGANDADGLLDALFIPARSSASLLTRVALRRLGLSLSLGSARGGRGRRIVVQALGSQAAIQLDGDPSGSIGGDSETAALEIDVLPGAIRAFEPCPGASLVEGS